MDGEETDSREANEKAVVQAMFLLNIYLFQVVGLCKSGGYVEENRNPGKLFKDVYQGCILC